MGCQAHSCAISSRRKVEVYLLYSLYVANVHLCVCFTHCNFIKKLGEPVPMVYLFLKPPVCEGKKGEAKEKCEKQLKKFMSGAWWH